MPVNKSGLSSRVVAQRLQEEGEVTSCTPDHAHRIAVPVFPSIQSGTQGCDIYINIITSTVLEMNYNAAASHSSLITDAHPTQSVRAFTVLNATYIMTAV
jgi:hypothetical protein